MIRSSYGMVEPSQNQSPAGSNRRDIPDTFCCASNFRMRNGKTTDPARCLPGGDEFILQQFAEVLARFDLSFVGTDLLDAIHERVDATVKGFQGEGGYQVGFLGEAESFKNGKDTVGAHELRTVQ